MLYKIRNLYKKLYLKRLLNNGLSIGKDFQMEKGCNIDANFPWLIDIGNNVTLASWVYLVAHDGASKKHIGYSKVGRINIGNNVFIGARSIVLPNVSIGDNCIIGANSIVTKNIPDNSVAAGNPAKVIMSLETYKKHLKEQISRSEIFEKEYVRENIDEVKKQEMKHLLENQGGFIV